MPQNDRYLYHELPTLLATTLKMSQAADALEKRLKRNTDQMYTMFWDHDQTWIESVKKAALFQLRFYYSSVLIF